MSRHRLRFHPSPHVWPAVVIFQAVGIVVLTSPRILPLIIELIIATLAAVDLKRSLTR